MAIRFQNLNLEERDLFGVSLEGTVSRSDKGALTVLADQAMKRGKVQVILDMSSLASLGGAGAGVLAGFQRRLMDEGGEAVFAGPQTIVRHFLDSKFGELPHRYFLNVEDACRLFHEKNYKEPDFSAAMADPEPSSDSVPDQSIEDCFGDDAVDEDDIGAMSFHDETDEADCELDGLLAEFTGKDARKGRRKDYHYTSLGEAVEALGSWHEGRNREEFGAALTNLLFSQGLADTVSLLFPAGIHLNTLDERWKLPLSGSFATQLVDYGRPLSMLDIRDDELIESEITFLEEFNPEMILPLLQDKQLVGVVILANDEPDREYTVGESFAFELLMQVLNQPVPEDPFQPVGEEVSAEETPPSPGTGGEDLVEAARSLGSGSGVLDTGLALILCDLAMDLPEADDRSHFWRVFQRHVSRMHPIENLAFLDNSSPHPQDVCGPDSSWQGLDMSHERLRLFFKSMQRPVLAENLPSLFNEVKLEMMKAGVQWLVPLRREDEALGMALVSGSFEAPSVPPEDRIMEIFTPTARLLARFEGRHQNADVSRGLVEALMAERETRCYGSDTMTRETVRHLNLLATEMGFPPDQHRDLVYGCLLRDIGMVGQSDELMTAPDDMSPEQLQTYYQHPERGRLLVESLGLPETIVEVIAGHHERFNGQGYPQGVAGRDIPLPARVVTVVENYVGMISGVGGQAPLTPEEASHQLQEDAGGRFDPDIVAVFLKAVQPEAPAPEPVEKETTPAKAPDGVLV